MHWIARHILKTLAFADELTYSQLKPHDVEGNLFQYHARTLEAEGLINRARTGYRLTPKGSAFVADMSATRLMRTQKQPQPMVAAYCRRGDQVLTFDWKRHPFRGLTSLPMGRHLRGMDVVSAAADQLFWKAGLAGTAQYLGLVETLADGRHTVTSMVGFTEVTQVSEPDGLTGLSRWRTLRELEADPAYGDLLDLVRWARDDNRTPYIRLVET